MDSSHPGDDELDDVVQGARSFGAFLAWLAGHAGSLAAIAAVVFLTCKVHAVSRGNLVTAQLLVTEGDTSKILLGTLLLVLPVLLVVPLVVVVVPTVVALWQTPHPETARRAWRGRWVFPFSVLIFVALLDLYLVLRFVPAGYAAPYVVVVVGGLWTGRWLARLTADDTHQPTKRLSRALRQADRAATPGVGVLALTASFVLVFLWMLFPVVLSDEMWLSAMSANVRGERRTVYVVARREGETVLLFERDRHVEVVPNDAWSDPVPCSLERFSAGRTVEDLLRGRDPDRVHPACPVA